MIITYELELMHYTYMHGDLAILCVHGLDEFFEIRKNKKFAKKIELVISDEKIPNSYRIKPRYVDVHGNVNNVYIYTDFWVSKVTTYEADRLMTKLFKHHKKLFVAVNII